MLQAFAEAGVDFSLPDIHGNYALHVACAQKNHKSMTMLLTHGADPSLRNAVNKESALDVCRRIKYQLGEKLLETFLNPSDIDDDEISEDENDKNSDSCFIAQSKTPSRAGNQAKESPRDGQNDQKKDTTGQSSNSRSNSNNN